MKFCFTKSYEQFLCLEVEANSLSEAQKIADDSDENDWQGCDEGSFDEYPPQQWNETSQKWEDIT